MLSVAMDFSVSIIFTVLKTKIDLKGRSMRAASFLLLLISFVILSAAQCPKVGNTHFLYPVLDLKSIFLFPFL